MTTSADVNPALGPVAPGSIDERESLPRLLCLGCSTSTEPCAMCAGAIYWIGVGRVVFALAETGLLRYTGSHDENPTLDLPCREVFARGQKKIVVTGPLLEDEAGQVHEGFWKKAT